MPRVLIITYYWPPSGGSAVLRWLKFSKYLREFGWEPVIYTPDNPEPQETDESLCSEIPEGIEILKTRIIEPYGIYKWLTGRKQHERLGVALMSEKKKPGLMSTISLWIRSNAFIPDPRMLWIKPSVKFLTRYLKNHPVELIISTGPPHSMHMIAMGLKHRMGIKWVADFRDPWTGIDFYKDLLLTRYADNRHKKLEMKVLRQADRVVTVSPGMSEDFKSKGILQVFTITNGYDDESGYSEITSSGKFSLVHLGSLPKSRNPENLWKVISQLVNEHEDLSALLEIKLIGKADQSVDASLKFHGLEKYVTRVAYIPHHQTLSILKGSSVLLLCINNTPNARSILTNKFFEYLSAARPILALGPPDGDAANILIESGAGRIFEYTDSEDLKSYLLKLFTLYSQGNLTMDSKGIEKFSRRHLTKELSELLNHLAS